MDKIRRGFRFFDRSGRLFKMTLDVLSQFAVLLMILEGLRNFLNPKMACLVVLEGEEGGVMLYKVSCEDP